MSTKKNEYTTQNFFTLLLQAVFTYTAPNPSERIKAVQPALGELIKVLLSDKEAYAAASRAGQFNLKDDGTVELTSLGEGLSMHKSKSMQNDWLKTNPVDLLFGARGNENRTSVDQKLEFISTTLKAFMDHLGGNHAPELNESQLDQLTRIVNGFNGDVQRIFLDTSEEE